ncbi:MAG: DUF5908 family protein [Bacteroidota bacterium]|nr:DUF5908 family protein [Bacteroidota bacterium]
MPIEIKELNIKINVTDNQNPPASGDSSKGKLAQEDLVAQCVEQVLEIISKTRER